MAPLLSLIAVAVLFFPARVSAGQSIITWTAPGDDGDIGQAAAYVVILDGDTIPGPIPSIAGEVDSLVLELPSGDHVIYVAAVDEAGNQGPLARLPFRVPVCGDFDGDGKANILDLTLLVIQIFRGGCAGVK